MATAPLIDSRPPALPILLREAGSLVAMRWKRLRPVVRSAGARAGHPVLVIPGFLASDHSTRLLRHTLDAAGYRSYGWAGA